MDIGVSYKELFPYDPSALREHLLKATPDLWEKNDFRQKAFDVHKTTKSVVYVWSDIADARYESVATHIGEDDVDPMHEEVWKIARRIRAHYGAGSRITKLMLAKLSKRTEISEHVDTRNLTIVHRCHLPIITNSQCPFFINRTAHHFKPTSVFELNNQQLHSVKNESDEDRVHLICDIFEPALLANRFVFGREPSTPRS